MAVYSDEPPHQLVEPRHGSRTGDKQDLFMGPHHPFLIPIHSEQHLCPPPAWVDLSLKLEAAFPPSPSHMSWFSGRLLSWDWSPLLLEEAGRTQRVPWIGALCLLVPNHAPHISPSGIHECCMAWLGHPHVPVPSNSEVVPQLPHRQVGDLGSCVAALHTALLGGLLPHTAVTSYAV